MSDQKDHAFQLTIRLEIPHLWLATFPTTTDRTNAYPDIIQSTPTAMRLPVRFFRGCSAFIFLALLSFILSIPAQSQPQDLPSEQLPGIGPPGPPISPEQRRIEHDRAKLMNKERFDSLKRDTDKLLELATELKQNVDRANENTLSLDVIKKADEIDKLAKQIREKMKGQ